MTQAEQVKARIVSAVTGQAVVPSIQAEAGEDRPLRATPAIRYYAEDTSAPEPFVPTEQQAFAKPDAQSAPSLAPELQEGLDAFRLGFANVYVYRAFKALEARVAKLEGR
jgi:hypothetical protein